MLKQGALDEVRAIVGVSSDLPAARALGVPQLLAHLRGDLTLDAAVSRAVTETRQFAKRQMTWFRHQMPNWHFIEKSEPGEMFELVAASI